MPQLSSFGLFSLIISLLSMVFLFIFFVISDIVSQRRSSVKVAELNVSNLKSFSLKKFF